MGQIKNDPGSEGNKSEVQIGLHRHIADHKDTVSLVFFYFQFNHNHWSESSVAIIVTESILSRNVVKKVKICEHRPEDLVNNWSAISHLRKERETCKLDPSGEILVSINYEAFRAKLWNVHFKHSSAVLTLRSSIMHEPGMQILLKWNRPYSRAGVRIKKSKSEKTRGVIDGKGRRWVLKLI